jgi:hypothetical protein
LTVACNREDVLGDAVDSTDPCVPGIGDIDVPIPVNCHPLWSLQACPIRLVLIASEPRYAKTGDRRDKAVAGAYHANSVV